MKIIKSLIIIFILISCSSKSISIQESFNQSVLIEKKNGEKIEGVVIDINENELLFLRANTKVMIKINNTEIKNINRSSNYYDLEGYVISESTYLKEKESSNSVVYSLIGGLSGGILGALIIGKTLPDTDPALALTLGALGGGTYGYQIGNDIDILKAVDKVKLKRNALKNIEKQIESKNNDKKN